MHAQAELGTLYELDHGADAPPMGMLLSILREVVALQHATLKKERAERVVTHAKVRVWLCGCGCL